MQSITTLAHPNIALIKYWGDRETDLHIPVNGSISMNLDELFTCTTVTIAPDIPLDIIIINEQPATNSAQLRAMQFLDRFRSMFGIDHRFRVESENNFPSSAGIASSASAFAALSLAATRICGLQLSEAELSRLARLGSGSACRSIPGGFVEWKAGTDHESSFAYSIAPPSHWDLVDCIAIVSTEEKVVSSRQGHALAHTSPLQQARIMHADQRLKECRQAILTRDFDLLARVVELDSNMMHAVMMTSNPPLLYWQSATFSVMQSVIKWRKKGLPVCYTVDAGANVHVLCECGALPTIFEMLWEISGVINLIDTKIGNAAFIKTNN